MKKAYFFWLLLAAALLAGCGGEGTGKTWKQYRDGAWERIPPEAR